MATAVWASRYTTKAKTIHEFCGDSVESIMKIALKRKTCDNITVVLIGLENLKQAVWKDENTNVGEIKNLSQVVESQTRDKEFTQNHSQHLTSNAPKSQKGEDSRAAQLQIDTKAKYLTNGKTYHSPFAKQSDRDQKMYSHLNFKSSRNDQHPQKEYFFQSNNVLSSNKNFQKQFKE